VFDKLLAEEGVHDRCLQFAGGSMTLRMGACATRRRRTRLPRCLMRESLPDADIGPRLASQDGAVGAIHSGPSASIFISATSPGSTTECKHLAWRMATRLPFNKSAEAADGNQIEIMAAISEQVFRMCCWKIVNSDLRCWGWGRDCQNRHTIALAVEQAVDQMKACLDRRAQAPHSKAAG